MSVQCPCKVEFIPEGGTAIVLADAGDWLAALPRFSAAQRMFETDGISAPDAWFKPLGGVLVTIVLEVEAEPADFPEAADHFLAPDSIGTVALIQTGGALVITSGETVATYDPAVIGPVTPGLPSVGGVLTTTKSYRIQAGLPVLGTLSID